MELLKIVLSQAALKQILLKGLHTEMTTDCSAVKQN